MIPRSSGYVTSDFELSISVKDRPIGQPFFTWGDPVQGKVVLRNSNGVSGVDASMRFTGISRSKIGSKGASPKSKDSSEAILFQFEKELTIRKRNKQGTEEIWPFEFHFPTTTQTQLSVQKFRLSSNHIFPRFPGHSLPPTFQGGARRGEEENNTITYTIEAILTRPFITHRFPSGGMSCDVTLPFFPVQDTVDPNADLTVVPMTEEHRFPTHGISLAVKVETPDSLAAGTKMPLYIGVRRAPSTSTANPPPLIHIRSILVSLIAQNHARVQAPYLGLGQEPYESWGETFTLCESGAINVLTKEFWDTNDTLKDIRIDESVLPSFRTYNIARTYRLRLRIDMSCENNTLPVEMERDFTVLPARYRNTPPPTSDTHPAAESGSQPRRSTAPMEEPPPPYEGVVAHRLPSFDTAVTTGAVAIAATGSGDRGSRY